MKAPAGEYQFIAEAKSADGKKMALKTDFDGMITGVSYSAEGPILHVGNQASFLGNITTLTEINIGTNWYRMGTIPPNIADRSI